MWFKDPNQPGRMIHMSIIPTGMFEVSPGVLYSKTFNKTKNSLSKMKSKQHQKKISANLQKIRSILK